MLSKLQQWYMKKIILHIALLSYTLVILKPALPYVSDFVGHVFFYTQHMATVHIENGKMHIHKEIVDNAKKEASQKELPSAKKQNSVNDLISLQQKDLAIYFDLKKLNPIPATTALINIFLPGEYLPPRV